MAYVFVAVAEFGFGAHLWDIRAITLVPTRIQVRS